MSYTTRSNGYFEIVPPCPPGLLAGVNLTPLEAVTTTTTMETGDGVTETVVRVHRLRPDAEDYWRAFPEDVASAVMAAMAALEGTPHQATGSLYAEGEEHDDVWKVQVQSNAPAAVTTTRAVLRWADGSGNVDRDAEWDQDRYPW